MIMMIFLGIILALVFLFMVVMLCELNDDSGDVVAAAAIGAVGFCLFIASLACFVEFFSPSISPIHVYQGRTTLEITYKDGIAIDSVVVWKED